MEFISSIEQFDNMKPSICKGDMAPTALIHAT
jgi:hypothetical protein